MIRPAVPEDAAAIAAVSIEVWVSTYIKHGMTREFAEYVLAEFTVERVRATISAPDEHVLVSDNAEGIDGYIRIAERCAAPVKGCGETEISTLYVQPRHQARGIGARLVQAAISSFGAGLWLKVNSENTGAIGFYDALGFERVGVTEFRLGEAAYANDVMVLRSSGEDT